MTREGPPRFCPKCDYHGRTHSHHCPECGASFFPSADGRMGRDLHTGDDNA